MVKGLDLFRAHFRKYSDQFVLIGGTACDLVMAQAGVPFRVTKDLDIVLLIESLTPEFGLAFWDFIRLGKYGAREKEGGTRQYYRFAKPDNPEYPVLLELFSKVPDGLTVPAKNSLASIPMGEDVSGLSAILLDDDYYGFLQGGRKVLDGLPIAGTEHLMALKAKAWLELSAKRARGEKVDGNDILKHKRDVFRLNQIADPAFSGSIPGKISQDMNSFLEAILSEGVDLKSIGVKGDSGEAFDSIRNIFRIRG